jgi:hypothetical protein
MSHVGLASGPSPKRPRKSMPISYDCQYQCQFLPPLALCMFLLSVLFQYLLVKILADCPSVRLSADHKAEHTTGGIEHWETSNCVGSEVFTAVTMKNGVFWEVTPCGASKNRRFGGT